MDLQEITNLIKVREYILTSIGNPYFDRQTVNTLNGMLILIDGKIVNLLQSDSFKEYINFKDVKKAIQDVARITNIKSGFIK